MSSDIKNIEDIHKDNAMNQSRRSLLVNSLIHFFDEPENLKQFLQVIEGKCNISLRLLDWLITNYAKSHNIMYIVNTGGVDKQFNIYLNYKTQLKAYSKKQFDPFQRRERISFKVTKENNTTHDIVTTIGQLNFFRWAIQNKVIEYAKENVVRIEKDMNDSIQCRKDTNMRVRNKRRKDASTIIQQYPQGITF